MGCFDHYGLILWTIIKLKRWRFLWFFIFVLSAMSNHILYDIVGSWVSTFGMKSYFKAGGDEFTENSIVIGNVLQNSNEFAILSDLIKEQRTAKVKKYEFEECGKSMSQASRTVEDERMDCTLHFLRKMVSQSANKFTHLVEFSSPPKVICNVAYGTEVYCPFIANLVSTAGYKIKSAKFRFRNVTVFRYVPPSKPPKPIKAGTNSMCAKDPEFSTVMPRATIVQAFLLICSLFVYLLASTVSSIADLKFRGFLQILLRRGLSVLAYWLALWTITLIELAIMGVSLAASYYMQCKGFYDILRLMRVVLAFCIHACTIASTIFLMTVVIKKQFIIGMATLMLASSCCVILGLSLLLLHWLKNLSGSRFSLLAVPPGLLGEQLQAILVGQLRPEVETDFHKSILIISSCVCVASVLLTLYLDYVLNSGSGLLQMAHFPCLMLCGRKRKLEPGENFERRNAVFEPVVGLNPYVRARELNKTFVSCRGSHVALRNVSVTLYENQLTAFVGHNGSGKSTLLDILNGNSNPSQGEIFVQGYDSQNLKTRFMLAPYTGICFQHDSLCNGITVANTVHLVHIACNKRSPRHELDYILKQLGLTDQLNKQVGQLSSGQKRKLCTALALLGNPKLICLDEPTSNLDPMSRRALWKLLQGYRRGRCIVVSTSRMEEADLIADRKVFLSGGSLICSGSSVFLRRAFDCGFIFQTKVKTERHVTWVLRHLNQKFPVLRARSIYRSNIELEVPATEDKLLPGVAETLEKMPDLVESFGLTQNALEQIFGRLKSTQRKDVEELFKTGEIGYTIEKPFESYEQERRKYIEVFSTVWSRSFTSHTPSLTGRIVAMVPISFARIRRKNSTIFTRICLPVLLVLLMVGSVIGEMLIKGGQISLWSVFWKNETSYFHKALCIDDSDNKDAGHTHHSDRICQEALNGLNGSDTAYPFVRKKTKTIVYNYLLEFLQHGNLKARVEFHKQCSTRSSNYEPCPILYASNWCLDDISNADRTISVGFYSLYEYFDIQVATRSLFVAFQRAVFNFNLKHAPNVTLQVEGSGVNDFRTTFIRLLGIFSQMFILTIIPATYMDDLIEDKSSGVRDQLKTLGLGSFQYWICNFIAHWIQYATVYIVTTLALFSILSNSYFYSCFILCIFLPTLFLGLASNQLCVYLFSTIFSKHNVVLAVVYSIFSVVLVMSLLLAQLDNMAGLILICTFPPVASLALTFYGSKMIIYAMAFTKVNSLSELSDTVSIVMMSIHVKVALLAMLGHIILLCVAIFIFEKFQSVSWKSNKGTNAEVPLSGDDQAVQEETRRLDSHPRDSQNLLEVRHLCVLSHTGANIIRDVSFAVKPGEILGLFGPNGSGKSSVVSAIAGHMMQNSGDCEALTGNNSWIPSRVATLQGKIGYCQSSNPLLSHITVQEHLRFYAAVFGVNKVKDLVKELLKIFHLEESKNTFVVNISNGVKRRLSMAIALIGDPSIVLIDDPTDGVDPEGRRLIWAAIKSIVSENRAVVVTMHAMEEDVDKLCSRVAVINHGMLVGLGTMDQILNRYGKLYGLSIQFVEDVSDSSDVCQARVEKGLKAVHAKFPDSFVVEQMAASILVCVPTSNVDRLSSVLKWLVEHKKPLGINLFSFRRIYLDEVLELIIKNHDKYLLEQRRSVFSGGMDPQPPQQPVGQANASIGI